MDPKEQKIKDLEGAIIVLEKSAKECTEAFEKLQGEFNKKAEDFEKAGLKINELEDINKAAVINTADLQEKIKALELAIESSGTDKDAAAAPRPASDDPYAEVEIPKGKFLILERVRYQGTVLESTPDKPVFSDLKKLDKKQREQMIKDKFIR